MSTTHLHELARLPVRGDRFVRCGEQLLVTNHRGSPPYALSVVDISSPATPRLVSLLPFVSRLQSSVVVHALFYVFERERALHLVLPSESGPVTLDCHLMFRDQVHHMERVGSRWLVGALNFGGVVVLDVMNPTVPVETARRKLGDSFVESFAVSGERIFVAAQADGLVELTVDADGALFETRRLLGRDDGFCVQQVFVVGDHLWVFGDGTLPYARPDENDHERGGELYVEPEPDPNTVVFVLSNLDEPVWFGASPALPKRMRALPDDGGAVVLDDYRCFHFFGGGGKTELLFQMQETRPDWEGRPDEPRRYLEVDATTDLDALPQPNSVTHDVAHWIRRGAHLYVQRMDELTVYAISPESPIARMMED
ncbi:MAG: hypothetical protein MUE69_22005 [Myxococcota bacterium]|jgi:hypothetical protein|nr:hypothetical protein [Myxococcota bacterium]